ncbi:MAG: hypothetical protein B6U97_02965 [Candidatus Altiarchaeales archaeon ex4484_96]|nr:MAG: hypothetical protein B6U97_02965 [Candidatus Altiarchaeales archaeon ex4484_96]
MTQDIRDVFWTAQEKSYYTHVFKVAEEDLDRFIESFVKRLWIANDMAVAVQYRLDTVNVKETLTAD